MEYIKDVELFLNDFAKTCKSVQKKSFKKLKEFNHFHIPTSLYTMRGRP